MLIDINGPPMPPGFIGFPPQPPMPQMPNLPQPNVQPFSYPSVSYYYKLIIIVFYGNVKMGNKKNKNLRLIYV